MSKKYPHDKNLSDLEKKFENVVPLTNEGYGADVVIATDVKPRQQPWFMDKIIPLDTSTLFAGFGNSGKSQLLIFTAAMTTTGKQFDIAGTEYQLPQGGVIILSGEDQFDTQLVPRLIAAEADLSKCFLLKMMKIPGKKKILLDLESHLHLIEKIILEQKEKGIEIKLIIVDPVQYFTGEMRDINSLVCRFISSLNDLSHKYNLALIMNKHLRKSGGGDGVSSAVDAVSGSGAWTTSPRSCWLIQRHPTKDGVIVFADLKGNLRSKLKKSPAFIIQEVNIPDPNNIGQLIQTTKLIWQVEMEDLTADEALNSIKLSPNEQAIRKWIIDFLLECNKKPGNGAMFSSSELGIEALTAGHKRTPYFETRKKMIQEGIISEYTDGRVKKTIMIKLNDPEMYK